MGQKTSIRIKKTGEGKPIVLLHAFPLSKTLFDDYRPPRGYALLTPDFPGFGDSPAVEGPFDLSDASESLRECLIGLVGTQPVILGGVSMGGYWTMEYLRLYPEQVEAAVFIATRAASDDPKAAQKRIDAAERVEKEGTGYLVPVMTPNLLGQTTLATNPKLVQRVQDAIRTAPPKGVAAAQRAMAVRRDQTDTLRALRVPSLWLSGVEDKFVNTSEAASNAALNALIRHIQVPRVGHLIPWEAPELFQSELNGFLASRPPS